MRIPLQDFLSRTFIYRTARASLKVVWGWEKERNDFILVPFSKNKMLCVNGYPMLKNALGDGRWSGEKI